jgi:hypothetical protein
MSGRRDVPNRCGRAPVMPSNLAWRGDTIALDEGEPQPVGTSGSAWTGSLAKGLHDGC